MKTPVAIIGAGPGGSALAMFLAKLGIESAIVEKETFPRYHIGESMTGECGGVVRALGLEHRMVEHRYPVKWGVHVYGHNPWFVPVRQRTAENELQDTFTWQVRRSEFDQMMLDEATAAGAQLVHGHAERPLMREDGSVRGVRVEMADGGVQDLETDVVVDVTGQSRWLANCGVAARLEIGHYDKQVAVFSQVRNAVRLDGKHLNDTLIFYKQLVHWAWFIPIDDETVSVGVVSPGSYFAAKHESKRDFLLRELAELHPELKRRVPDLDLVEEVRAVQNYSYQVPRFTGKGWLCIGDAHRFIDPIFSFGLYATMKEAQFAAPAIKSYLEGAGRDAEDPFAAHAAHCDRGLDKFQDLIDAFWSHPLAFAIVAHHKHPDGTVDLFAGRIYGHEHNPALEAMRQIKQHKRSWWEEQDNWWDTPPESAAEQTKPVS